MAFSLKGAAAVATREDEGTDVALLDEQREPLMTLVDGVEVPAVAHVAGKLSSVYRRAEQNANDKLAKAFKANRAKEFDAEAQAEHSMRIIAACVQSWNLTDNGTPIPCTVDNVVQVFKAAPWVLRDIEGAMSDPARFLR